MTHSSTQRRSQLLQVLLTTAAAVSFSWLIIPGTSQALSTDQQAELDSVLIFNNLASLYQAQGRYVEAEPFLRRAIQIRESYLGIGHPYVAHSLIKLANLYEVQDRDTEAEPLMEQASLILRDQPEELNTEVAQGLSALARVYQNQERYSEAELLLERALRIREAQLGADHPYVAAILSNLAIVREARNQF